MFYFISNMAKKPNKTTYPRTISLELHQVWNQYRRRKDGETLAMELGFSRPIIDRALKHGYVKTEGVAEAISKFFTDRLQKERLLAVNMTGLLKS